MGDGRQRLGFGLGTVSGDHTNTQRHRVEEYKPSQRMGRHFDAEREERNDSWNDGNGARVGTGTDSSLATSRLAGRLIVFEGEPEGDASSTLGDACRSAVMEFKRAVGEELGGLLKEALK